MPMDSKPQTAAKLPVTISVVNEHSAATASPVKAPESPQEPPKPEVATPAAPPPPNPALEVIKAAERALVQQKQAWKDEYSKGKAELDSERAEFQSWKKAKQDAKRDPLGFVKAAGLEYDEISEAVLNDGKPTMGLVQKTVDEQLAALRAEFEAKEKAREETYAREKEEQQALQVQSWHRSVAESVKAAGEKYELINALNLQAQVGKDVEAAYAEGKELTPEAAATAFEKRLRDEVAKLKTTKVWAELTAPEKPVLESAPPGRKVVQVRDATTVSATLAGVTGQTTNSLEGLTSDQRWAALKKARGL